MKKLLSFAVLSLATGCSSYVATPQYVNGGYYMIGDSNCVAYRPLSDSSIMCADTEGKETGYRTVMSAQDIQMYQMQMMENRLAMIQLQQNAQNFNQSMQQNMNYMNWQLSNQIQQNTNNLQMQMMNNQRRNINCLHTGMITNCTY
jgi:lipoprotein